jgi:hypothetical protein
VLPQPNLFASQEFGHLAALRWSGSFSPNASL